LSYLGGGLSYTAGGGLSRITGGAGGAACLDLTLDGADDGFLKKGNRFYNIYFIQSNFQIIKSSLTLTLHTTYSKLLSVE
jgi:hypothetical protein